MRRSAVVLGPEPCTSSTWCSDISPALSGTSTPSPSGTSTAISWPRVSRLSAAKVSRCSSWFLRWLPGQNFMAPLSTGASAKATQAVMTSLVLSPQ